MSKPRFSNGPTGIYVGYNFVFLCLCTGQDKTWGIHDVKYRRWNERFESQNVPKRCWSWRHRLRKFILSASVLCESESGLCFCPCLSVTVWSCSRDWVCQYYKVSTVEGFFFVIITPMKLLEFRRFQALSAPVVVYNKTTRKSLRWVWRPVYCVLGYFHVFLLIYKYKFW